MDDHPVAVEQEGDGSVGAAVTGGRDVGDAAARMELAPEGGHDAGQAHGRSPIRPRARKL